MDTNYVTTGDRVVKGQLIGTIGNGNKWSSKGVINTIVRIFIKYFAHVHFDISRKAITQEYVTGWSKKAVKDQYVNPYDDMKEEDYDENDIIDFDHLGWDWLDWSPSQGLWHPGLDLNGPGAGDADFGLPIYAPIDGVVTYEKRTWGSNGGWGNVIVIKKDDAECKHCELHCPK